MAVERDRSERSVALGVFPQRSAADNAVDTLLRAGFRRDEISVMTRETIDARDIGATRDTEAGEGAAAGAVTGGTIGGIGGLLVGAGTLVIPGIGPVLAVGPILAALTGLAAGAGVGGAIGAFVGVGVPDDDATYLSQQLRSGATLVGVPMDTRFRTVEQAFYAQGAFDVLRTTLATSSGSERHEVSGTVVARRREATEGVPAEPPRTTAPDVGPRPAQPPPSEVAPEPRFGAVRRQPRPGAAARARDALREVTAVARPMRTETMEEMREHPAETIFEQFEQLPDNFYYFATLGSILASLVLYVTGNKWTSLFVGLWAPSITAMAMFLKLLRPSREVRGH